MKPAIPFLLLGGLGLAGTVTTTGTGIAPASTTAGPVTVQASLERTTLPANTTGDTFVRVALTGKELPKQQQQQRPAVSLTLVIDRSGSMGGENKMEAAEEAACAAIKALQQGDKFAVVSFDDGAELLSEASYSSESVKLGCKKITELFARSGTDMVSGLDVGGKAARRLQGKGRVNRLLLLSDGQPNTADGLEQQVALLAREGIVTTTIGLGTDYNEDLMSRLADRGLGNSYFVESRPGRGGSSTTLAQIFKTELSSMTEIVAKATTVTLTPLHGLVLHEVIGFPSEASKGGLVVPVGDIYSGHTIELLVRAQHPSRQAGEALVKLIDVTVGGTEAQNDTRFGSTIAINATFSDDEKLVMNALVPTVAVTAEKWRTTQAMLKANEAYNRGDYAAGDQVLNEQKAHVRKQAAVLAAPSLAEMADEVDSMQSANTSAGASGRASMNKAMKEKARDMQRNAKK